MHMTDMRVEDRLDLEMMSPDQRITPMLDMSARDTSPPTDMTPSPTDQGPPPPDLAPPDLGPDPVDMPPDQGQQGPVFMICSGQRVDISSDVNHCGGCDISCEQGQGTCVNAQCVCPLPGAITCGESGRCVDALYDPRNCGDCGITCGVGEACDQGMCVCRPGLERCNGQCVDKLADPLNCGMCGRDCGEGNRCKAGQCGESLTCGAQYTPCRRDGRTACVRDTVDQESDLYCRPGSGFNLFCGEECGGDEVCFEPTDLINPIQCRPYRPARACDRCPCDECRNDEVCRRQILGVEDVTYCVRKP